MIFFQNSHLNDGNFNPDGFCIAIHEKLRSSNSYAIISLDTHAAFSHTLPSKNVVLDRIRKCIDKYFISPVLAET